MEALFGIALLAGLALVCVGLRRRAVGTTTLCARCEFNLDGLYPAVRTCPECGEMLSKHAPTIGPRARRPRLALGGAALAITAGVPLIGGLAVPAERKPSFLLVLEARGFPSGEPDHAIDELIRRMGRKQLSASTTASLVEAALREQASREHRWNPNWGRLFEAANSAGATTPEQQLRYAQRAGVIDVQIQQRIHRGQIPYAVLRVATDGDGRGYHVGPRGILLEWSLVGVSIDGAAQSLLSHELADWPLERLASARWLACTGGQVPCDPANGYETLQPSQAPPIIDAPPGEHLVSFRWDLAAHLGDVGAPVVRWTLKPSVRMQVVSRADPVVELVTDDATGRTVQQAMEYADGSRSPGPAAGRMSR